MKKLTRIIGSLLSALLISFAGFGQIRVAKAESKSSAEFSNKVVSIIEEYSTNFKKRVGGSNGEKEAAVYIKKYLDDHTNLSPKDNAYVKEGVQTFDYESSFTSKFETSQNIIYYADLNPNSDKKVILGCNYDAYAYKFDNEKQEYKETESESVNGSSASVAFLLALASEIDTFDLDYDVEFVFFGAGEIDRAGSKVYTDGFTEDSKKNILCMMNFDGIALGKHTYYYLDEVSSSFSKYLDNMSRQEKSKVKEVDGVHLGKVILAEKNSLGLSYTHVALESDNINFMSAGVLTINFFAGDYETGIVMGRSEFGEDDILTYTEKDNVEYISKNIGFEKVTQNLNENYKFVMAILTDADFVASATEAKNETKGFYSFFANTNLLVYLTAIAFIVFVVVAMYIYYKLSVKSYYANVESEFLSTVIKLSESIDAEGKDMNVPKAISQVVARDIKKDKTIKTSKKDKKNKKED